MVVTNQKVTKNAGSSFKRYCSYLKKENKKKE